MSIIYSFIYLFIIMSVWHLHTKELTIPIPKKIRREDIAESRSMSILHRACLPVLCVEFKFDQAGVTAAEIPDKRYSVVLNLMTNFGRPYLQRPPEYYFVDTIFRFIFGHILVGWCLPCCLFDFCLFDGSCAIIPVSIIIYEIVFFNVTSFLFRSSHCL